MKKVLFLVIILFLVISNISLNTKNGTTNHSQVTLEMMNAKAGDPTENLPPDPIINPIPNKAFPIDWSFSAIIEYFFG